MLVVASGTPALDADLKDLGWSLRSLGAGYWRIQGCDYPGLAVFLDDVSDAERDDLIGCFGHRMIRTEASAAWITERAGLPQEVAMARVEGFDQFITKLAANKVARNRILSSMSPKERLAGLKAEERLTDLSKEEKLLAMPDEVLRGLRPDYVAKLSPQIRRKIARRLKRPIRH